MEWSQRIDPLVITIIYSIRLSWGSCNEPCILRDLQSSLPFQLQIKNRSRKFPGVVRDGYRPYSLVEIGEHEIWDGATGTLCKDGRFCGNEQVGVTPGPKGQVRDRSGHLHESFIVTGLVSGYGWGLVEGSRCHSEMKKKGIRCIQGPCNERGKLSFSVNRGGERRLPLTLPLNDRVTFTMTISRRPVWSLPDPKR